MDTRFKVWLTFLVILSSGIIVGAMGHAYYLRRSALHALEGGPEAINRLMVHRLRSELSLTETQATQMGVVLRSFQDELQRLRSRHRPEIESIMSSTEVSARSFLDEEQRQKLHQVFERFKDRFVGTSP